MSDQHITRIAELEALLEIEKVKNSVLCEEVARLKNEISDLNWMMEGLRK